MANLDEAFKTTPIPQSQPERWSPTYGHICRICGGCYNYHKTRHVQSKNPHEFVKGQYRQLLPFETYPFDEIGGYPYVN